MLSLLLRFGSTVFALCLTVFACLAQSSTNTVMPPVPIPPPPSAATLGKFGDIPVSLYTGTTSVEIPLYTIKTKSHTVPISLAYHASGIRVEEEASNVGLGWALNAGGVITRSVRDADDLQENNTGTGGKAGYVSPAHRPLPGWDANNRYNANGTTAQQRINDTGYYCDNMQDTQPDVFYYNFQGHSGKFYIETASGSTNIIARVQAQGENLLIESLLNANNNICWQIRTEDGYKYVFMDRETTRAINESATSRTSKNGTLTGSPMKTVDMTYTSSWFLSTITAPDGEVITFTYDNVSSYQTYKIPGTSTREAVKQYYQTDKANPGPCEVIGFSDVYYYSTVTSSYQIVNPSPVLASIKFQTGQVTFLSQARSDLAGGFPGSPPKRITGLLVHRGVSPVQSFVKGVDFIQSYFSNPSFNSNDAYASLRLRLDGIEERGDGPAEDPTYRFEYNYDATNTFLSLPRKNSFAKDHYGYFNGALSNDQKSVLLPHLSATVVQPDNTQFSLNSDPSKDADRDYHSSATVIGCLKKITYPTKGTTTFEFEGNDYDTYNSAGGLNGQQLSGPGIRIKTVTSRSDATAPPLVKRYLYQAATGTSGLLMSELSYATIEQHDYTSSSCKYGITLFVLNRFATTLSPMGTAAQGRPVGYSLVTQLDGAQDANGNVVFNNGKTEYYYSNVAETPAIAPFVPGTPNHPNPKNGSLLRQVTYKCTAPAAGLQPASYQKVAETISTYEVTDLYSVKGAVLRQRSCPGDKDEFIRDNGASITAATVYELQDIVKYYDNESYWLRKTGEQQLVYDQYSDAKSTTTSTTYTYGNAAHHKPTVISKTLADGQVVKVYTAYPGDYYRGQPALTAMGGTLRNLVRPVETFTTLTKPGGVENVTAGTYNHYVLTGPNNQVAVPSQVDQLRLSTPLAYSSFQRSAPAVTPDPRYEPQQYATYEPATANPATMRKADDVLTSYQWGYGGQLPVGVYRNADRTPPQPGSPALGNEASSTGFESGTGGVGTNADEDYWTIDASSSLNSFVTTPHTGAYAWQMGPATGQPNFGPGRTFSPARQQLRYRLSAWVKTAPGTGATDAYLVLSVNRANGSQVQGVASCYQASRVGYTDGRWRYVEVVLDLNAAHTDLGIAPTAERLQLVAYTYNSGGATYLIDDLRVEPVEASTTTYTYDTENRQPTSSNDARNYPAYYEYDRQQRLLIVKDHLADIRKHFEYHYQQQP